MEATGVAAAEVGSSCLLPSGVACRVPTGEACRVPTEARVATAAEAVDAAAAAAAAVNWRLGGGVKDRTTALEALEIGNGAAKLPDRNLMLPVRFGCSNSWDGGANCPFTHGGGGCCDCSGCTVRISATCGCSELRVEGSCGCIRAGCTCRCFQSEQGVGGPFVATGLSNGGVLVSMLVNRCIDGAGICHSFAIIATVTFAGCSVMRVDMGGLCLDGGIDVAIPSKMELCREAPFTLAIGASKLGIAAELCLETPCREARGEDPSLKVSPAFLGWSLFALSFFCKNFLGVLLLDRALPAGDLLRAVAWGV